MASSSYPRTDRCTRCGRPVIILKIEMRPGVVIDGPAHHSDAQVTGDYIDDQCNYDEQPRRPGAKTRGLHG